MTLRVCLPIVLMIAAPGAAAQEFDARAYLDRAITVVWEKGLNAAAVDWTALSAKVHAQGAGARDVFDTYPALVTLVRGLGDHHSFLQLSEERAAAYRAAKGRDFVYPPTGRPSRADRRLYGRALAGTDRIVAGARVRTVVVSGIMGNAQTRNAYAASLDRAVAAAPRPCGWVIDLRGNTGGNMWPMLAGLRGLLGEGRVGGYVGRNAAETEYWRMIRTGAALESADGTMTPAQEVEGEPAAFASAPVAILTDGGTASSGELVAVAFAGRANTRRFGSETAGVSTATEGFPLSDGANLVIVTSVAFDRTGRRYPAGLVPDIVVPPERVEDAAQRWVATRCARP